MKRLLGRRSIVGLEFDDGVIRGIEIFKKNSALAVSAHAQIPIPEEAVQEGLIRNQEQITAALDQLWAKGKFKTRDVVIGVSNQGVVIRFAVFPQVAPDRLDNLVRFQAQEYLPVPLDTAVLDYHVIGMKSDGERQLLEVLLVAGRREMLDGFLEVLTLSRLRAKEIEVLPLTLLRFLHQEEAQQVVAVVNIGNGLSNMLISEARKPRLARMMLSGIQAAKKLVAATAEIDSIYASSEDENEELAKNIRATIGFYQSHKEAKPVEKILLSGIGSKVAGLASSLEARLRLPVTVVKPLEYLGISPNGVPADLIDYSIAASLACRGWE